MNKVKLFQISLNRGERTKIPQVGHGELIIQCHQGAAWLTAAADPQDYIVEGGEQMCLEHPHEDILVESLSEHLEIEVYRCA